MPHWRGSDLQCFHLWFFLWNCRALCLNPMQELRRQLLSSISMLFSQNACPKSFTAVLQIRLTCQYWNVIQPTFKAAWEPAELRTRHLPGLQCSQWGSHQRNAELQESSYVLFMLLNCWPAGVCPTSSTLWTHPLCSLGLSECPVQQIQIQASLSLEKSMFLLFSECRITASQK